MAAKDVEAGRAYVTLYLRRVGFDQQVQEAEKDWQTLDRKTQEASQPQSRPAPRPAAVNDQIQQRAAKFLPPQPPPKPVEHTRDRKSVV